MSIQDLLDLVVLHCGFDINFKPNVSSMLVTKVSFSFFFNSILKSSANIMGMVLQPYSGTIEYSSENFGANVPK
jgi:acetoin utilization deacetylase AcuC-like enzyme